MHKELFAIAEKYGDSCADCKEVCCVNMALTIKRDELRKMAEFLKMDPLEFRKEYTVLFRNFLKNEKEDMEFKAVSEEGREQMRLNPRIIVFENYKDIDSLVTPEQKKRLLDHVEKEKQDKVRIMVCPFLDKKTKKCTIHKVRPGSCYAVSYTHLRAHET